VILNFNGLRKLHDKLVEFMSSVINTRYPNLEIVFVDNGSIDKSVDVIERSFDKNRIRIVRLDKNYGYATGNNLGFRACSTDSKYIAFLNNDMKVTEDWLMKLIIPLEKDPEIGVIGPKQIVTSGLTVGGGYIDLIGMRYFITNDDLHFNIQEVSFVGGAMVIRRNVFELAGGFDDSFFLQNEEVDLCWRVWLLGWKVCYAPNSIIYHLGAGTSGRGSWLHFYAAKNWIATLIKNYECKNLIKYGPILISLFVIFFFYVSLMRRSDIGINYIKGLLWNIRHFKSTWRNRLHVQSLRKLRDFDLREKGILLRPDFSGIFRLAKRSSVCGVTFLTPPKASLNLHAASEKPKNARL
jgi:GT2 family glycosyltransferase